MFEGLMFLRRMLIQTLKLQTLNPSNSQTFKLSFNPFSMLRALIIEDEAHNRELVRKMLDRYCPDVSVIAEAADVASGAALIRNTDSFDLLFLDVQLPDGTGFNILEQLERIDFELIFVTAYDHYALEAIRFCAIDYLLKPLKVEDLQKAVGRVIARRRERTENQLLQQLLANRSAQEQKRIALPTAEQIHLIAVSDIIRCQGESNYTHFYLRDGRNILVSKTLREYEDLLKDYHFMRTHQSHLVNLREVDSFVKTRGGYLLMKDGSKVNVSRHRRDEVLEKLFAL